MNDLFNTLIDLAEDNNAVLYNICFRNAGVGFQWYEENTENKTWKDGLVVHAYYPSLAEAMEGEFIRLQGVAGKKV